MGIVKDKPYLTWYVRNPNKLSAKSIVEHVLNFGNWDDYLRVEEALGIKKTKELFESIAHGNRVNLRKKTVSYFEKYFQKYA